MARVTKDDFSPIKVLIIEIFVLGALTVFTLYWGGLLFNSGAEICGHATFEGMTIKVDQKQGNMIKVIFDNPTDTEMNIGGWDAKQEACLTTTKGEYWFDFDSFMGYTIPAHSKREAILAFNNVEGEAINLKIDCIQTLVHGLPAFGGSKATEIDFTNDDKEED